jgi:hypothetical protein
MVLRAALFLAAGERRQAHAVAQGIRIAIAVEVESGTI